MKNLLFIALSAIVLMTSCNKDEKLEITMKQSGKLTVTVEDLSGNPIVDEPVYLNNYSAYEAKKTDENGKVDFGTLLIGTYQVEIKNVEIGGTKYYVNQMATVTIGNTTKLQILPEEYVGSAIVSLIDRSYNYDTDEYNNTPIADVDVIAITQDDYMANYDDVEAIKKAAISSGVTNAAGEVILEDLPTSSNIYICHLLDPTEWEAYDNLYLAKYEEREINIYVY